MSAVNGYTPDYLVTPGEVLEEYLVQERLSQVSLAARTGLAPKTINEIIKAKSAITAETALRLERTLGRPAHFWGNLERQYQEDKVRLADKIRLEECLPWLSIFPVNEMAKLGWIEKLKDKVMQLDALLRFFAVASPEGWDAIWGRKLQAAFRKTEQSQENVALISAWLRRGEIIAQNQSCSPFDKQKFQNSLAEIRRMTTVESPGIFVPRLKSICAAAGVAVVFVDALPKLGVYGASYWGGGKYVMQLSSYRKSHDQLWFTVFHEACHIIHHSRKELYVGEGQTEDEKARENEANAFARDKLIPTRGLKTFLGSTPFPTLHGVAQFAKSIGIAPGIVVGRLQHDGVLSRKVGNGLKAPFNWSEG
jgi:addiction module HigA family antidote